MEDSLTCSICMEIFREPVQLSCRHNFCRECLELYSAGSDCSNATEDLFAVLPTCHVIACPFCLTTVYLGKRGIKGLPINVSLAAEVDKYLAQGKSEDNVPCCSMCDDDGKTAAVKYCHTCCVLYCRSCLEAFHPMRGPLKRHGLMTIEQYLSRHATVVKEETGNSSAGFCSLTLCDLHSQSYSIYCGTCDQLMCTRCVSQHNGHRVNDISSVCGKKKLELQEEIETQKKLIEKLDHFLAKMVAFKNDVKAKMDLHCMEVETAYKKTLQALRTWRKERLDLIEKRHEKWIQGYDVSIRQMNRKSEELKAMVKSSSASLSTTDVSFLKEYFTYAATCQFYGWRKAGKNPENRNEQESRLLASSVHQQTEVVEQELSQNVEKVLNWRMAVQKDKVYSKRLHLKEDFDGSVINRPQMKFTSPTSDYFLVCENGSLISHNRPGGTEIILADISLQTGRHYWELELNIAIGWRGWLSPDNPLCSAGVETQINDTGSQELGRLPTSATVLIRRNRMVIIGGGKTVLQNLPPSPSQNWAWTFGFYLDCEAGTLTILNCTEPSVLFTLSVNLNTPVTPAVRLADPYNSAIASVRLISGDMCIVPRFLLDKLKQY